MRECVCLCVCPSSDLRIDGTFSSVCGLWTLAKHHFLPSLSPYHLMNRNLEFIIEQNNVHTSGITILF